MSDNKIVENYSQVYGSPFLVGVFMGVNAIKDVALFVDGPDCNFYRVDMIYKTHDLCSTIKRPSINTRLYFSGVMPNKMVTGYDDVIKKKLGFIDNNNEFNLGILTSMPVTGLLGVQYNNIFSDFNKDFIFVRSYTDKFWVDGYSLLLREIAKNIKLDPNKDKKKNTISIIGFLFDRNEGDSIGNIEEIKRIMGLIGVEVNSVWLDGGFYSDLGSVDESELLVSLPYGKHASKILKRRLGTDIIDLDTPLGFKNTINFIKSIGERLGIDKEKLNSVIDKEFKSVKGKIDLLNSNMFLNKNYIYAGDPFLENGIKDIGSYLGMNHIKTYSYTGSKEYKKEDIGDTNIDLVIGNSDFNFSGSSYMKMEFGFPSYNTHFLTNRPFMGFEGLLNFVERLYEKLQ